MKKVFDFRFSLFDHKFCVQCSTATIVRYFVALRHTTTSNTRAQNTWKRSKQCFAKNSKLEVPANHDSEVLAQNNFSQCYHMCELSLPWLIGAALRAPLSTHTVKSRIFMFQAPSDRWFDDSTKSSRKVEDEKLLKNLFFRIAGETRLERSDIVGIGMNCPYQFNRSKVVVVVQKTACFSLVFSWYSILKISREKIPEKYFLQKTNWYYPDITRTDAAHTRSSATYLSDLRAPIPEIGWKSVFARFWFGTTALKIDFWKLAT